MFKSWISTDEANGGSDVDQSFTAANIFQLEATRMYAALM